MGNVESGGEGGALGAVDAIQQQLDVLERSLVSLEDDHKTRFAAEQLDGSTAPSGDVVICGARLTCREDVRVLTGPVVGRVDASSAMILLEVDSTVRLKVAWSVVDDVCFEGRCVGSLERSFVAKRPAVVTLTGLSAGVRYIVSFGGVHRTDAVQRTAEFVTFGKQQEEDCLTRFACVSRDRLLSNGDGFDRWDTLKQRCLHRGLPNLSFVVHVGGQVELQRAFEAAWSLLRRSVESVDEDGLNWLEMEERALEILRDAYRFAWNLPGKREVLASCSQFMLCSDLDVMPNFESSEALRGGGQVAATMLRLARRVFWEYQRALWDARVPQLLEREDELSALTQDLATKKHEALFRCRLASDAEAQLESLPPEKAAELEKSFRELDRRGKKAARDLIAAEAAMTDDSRSAEAGDETSLHVLGNVALLLLDTRWSTVAQDGSLLQPGKSKQLVPEAAWDQLSNLLLEGADLDVTALIIATEEPPLAPNGKSRWTPGDLKRLLDLLFGFLRRSPNRTCLLLAGGDTDGGIDSLCKSDKDENLYFRQLTVGSIAGGSLLSLSEAAWELQRPMLMSKKQYYTVEHRRRLSALECSYLEGVVAVPKSRQEPTRVHAELQSLHYDDVEVTIGPVMGLVTSTAANVLLEIAHSAPVTCFVTDALSGKKWRRLRNLKAGRPYVFRFADLAPDRFYTVHFRGVEHASKRRGSFTTLGEHKLDLHHNMEQSEEEYEFRLLAVAGNASEPTSTDNSAASMLLFEEAEEAAVGAGRLWHAVRDALDAPYSAPNVTVHLGGQVDMRRAVPQAVVLLNRSMEEAASEQLRGAYRSAWNAPGVREALAHGSHLMCRGALDDARDGSREVAATLRRLSKQVFREYQRLLWDDSNEEQEGEWYFARFGGAGVFVMDLRHSAGDLICPEQWAALSEALDESPGLQALYVCSELPFVDDSVSDAQFKATQSQHSSTGWPAHGSELVTLLTMLFDWEKQGSRKAFLVAGGAPCGFLTDVGPGLRQMVVGPIGSRNDNFPFELEGTLSKALSYTHSELCHRQNFGSILARWHPSRDDVVFEHSVHAFAGETAAEERRRRISRRKHSDAPSLMEEEQPHHATELEHLEALKPREAPKWIARLVDTLAEEGWAAGAALACCLGFTAARENLQDIYEAAMWPRDTPAAFAKALAPALALFYLEPTQTQLRELVPCPSTIVVGLVAAKWDRDGPIEGHLFRVPLKLIDATSFERLVTECFAIAQLVAKHETKNEKAPAADHHGR